MLEQAYTLMYIVCVLSGDLKASDLKYRECFADRTVTSQPLTRDSCEQVRAELTLKPHTFTGHDPKKGRFNIGVVVQAKCVQLQDA